MVTAIGSWLLWSALGLSVPTTPTSLPNGEPSDGVVSVTDDTPLDTVVSIQPGDVLRIENLSGDLLVQSWDRSEVSVESDDRRDSDLELSQSAGRLVVRASLRKGRDRNNVYVVSVPAWLPVEIRGVDLDVRAEGLGSRLEVNTRDGDISVRNHSGDVVARTLDGAIDVRRSTGSFDLTSLDDDVGVLDIEGDVFIQANDGDIEMIGIDAGVLEAGTMDGDIDFSGVIRPGGEYELTTHDGDISFRLPADASAEFSVATYSGDFETELPILLQRLERGGELNFELGGGGARVRLRAFDGAISLLEGP